MTRSGGQNKTSEEKKKGLDTKKNRPAEEALSKKIPQSQEPPVFNTLPVTGCLNGA